MLKKCKLCNKEFEASHFNMKYCCEEHQKLAQKEQIKNWHTLHPDYHREWRRKHPEYNSRYNNSVKNTFNEDFINLIYSGDYSLNDIPNIYRIREEETPGYIKSIVDMYVNSNFTCEISNKKGNTIHHLNAYHWDTDNRCNYDNMIVLHSSIHRFFHFLYGYRNNTKEQFDEFLNLHFCLSIDDILTRRSWNIWS